MYACALLGAGRYHCILNLDDFNLAITRNILSPRMLSEQCQPSYPEPFPRKYPDIAASFRTMLGESVWAHKVLRVGGNHTASSERPDETEEHNN